MKCFDFIIIYSFRVFLHKWVVFHWSFSDSKSSQVSRTRLRILAVLSNAVVWIVSNCPPTSESSRPYNNPLVIVPNAPITIGTIVTFMFHSFFNSLARSRYLSLFSHSFRFILWSAGTAKSRMLQILFFFVVDYFEAWSSGRDFVIRLYVNSHRSLCKSYSRTGAGLCIYHLFVWSNWNFLHISQWTTLPTQSCLALYSLCANLLHSLIMWLSVSSLSPHCLHLLFCWVLSILALIWLVLMALSFAAIRRDSVSLLKFLFLSQVQDFWCEILFIWRLKRPIELFSSPFLFPSRYHSFVYRVVSIVSDGRN